MKLNRRLLRIWSISVILLALLLMVTDSGFAVPCTPCGSWGEIKSCFDPNPPACCTCTKFETLYYYFLYYLHGDALISPDDILTGKYRSEYEVWRMQLSSHAAIESTTWGAIKNLFSAR